jgi:hypothetical protein
LGFDSLSPLATVMRMLPLLLLREIVLVLVLIEVGHHVVVVAVMLVSKAMVLGMRMRPTLIATSGNAVREEIPADARGTRQLDAQRGDRDADTSADHAVLDRVLPLEEQTRTESDASEDEDGGEVRLQVSGDVGHVR